MNEFAGHDPGRQRGRRTWMRLIIGLCVLACASVLQADTLVMKDGTIVEGKIVRKSRRYVRILTKFGEKSFKRNEIERIVEESLEGSALNATQQIHDFEKLPDIARVLKNAQALYDLGRFEEIPPLVEPLLGKGSKLDDLRIRWLLIEHYERQAKWEDAERMLKEMLVDGREPDKIRAQVHLDIFKENPGYKLVEINGVSAREFLDRDMFLAGKNRNALQDPAMMQAAIREVLRQILRDEKVSVYALRDSLDENATLAAVNKAIEEKTKRPIIEVLPYRDELAKVENSIYRASAIMPEATHGFELDVVRTEARHLDNVLRALLATLSQAYPGDESVGADEFGRLTAEGRAQWRQRCDEFLDLSRPIEELIEYLLKRTRAYPESLKPFIKEWEDALERVHQMQQNTVRNRDRTRI